MKIRVAVTIDVDVEAWTTEYGDDRAAVRDSVKAYVVNGIQSCYPATERIFTDVVEAR